MEPVITFALPVYNSSPILWLQLESLCRQKTQYSWELVVCEDPSKNFCGEKYFNSYKDRLKSAGCVNFKYIELDQWVPLSYKWKILADFSNSENFILGSSDDYSPYDRIEKSYKHLITHTKVDWEKVIFYDLNSGAKALWVTPEHKTGIFAALKTEAVLQAKPPYPLKGVDGWIRDNQKEFNLYRVKDLPKGLGTDGANTLSTHRSNLYSDPTTPFTLWDNDISTLIPTEILHKLNTQFKL